MASVLGPGGPWRNWDWDVYASPAEHLLDAWPQARSPRSPVLPCQDDFTAVFSHKTGFPWWGRPGAGWGAVGGCRGAVGDSRVSRCTGRYTDLWAWQEQLKGCVPGQRGWESQPCRRPRPSP